VRARLDALSPRALIALAVGGALVYTLAVWFLVVAPKRSEAAGVNADIAAAEIRLAQAQATTNHPPKGGASVADVFRLAKAMPSSADQPGLVLELDRLARASGVTLGSITPQEPAVGVGGATMIPVAVVVGGSYREITRFLTGTRRLVTVSRGKLRATGRLFTVQSVELSESNSEGFPFLDGTITLNAYVYDGPIVPPSAPVPAEEPPTSGTSAQGAAP
jgi:Tfp pilus assembly protein PilO